MKKVQKNLNDKHMPQTKIYSYSGSFTRTRTILLSSSIYSAPLFHAAADILVSRKFLTKGHFKECYKVLKGTLLRIRTFCQTVSSDRKIMI